MRSTVPGTAATCCLIISVVHKALLQTFFIDMEEKVNRYKIRDCARVANFD